VVKVVKKEKVAARATLPLKTGPISIELAVLGKKGMSGGWSADGHPLHKDFMAIYALPVQYLSL
jgi:hypothetical protein